MCREGPQVELYRERCVVKVLKLSSEVSECKPLQLGAGGVLLAVRHVLGHCAGRREGRGLHSSTFQLNLSRFGHTSPCAPIQ